MRNYEVFNTERELLNRIDELKDNGYQYAEFEVYTANDLSEDHEYYHDVEKHDDEVSFTDKVAAFFTGEDPEERAFGKYDWEDSVTEEAKTAVENGQYVLVVSREGYYDNEDNFAYLNDPEYRVDNELNNREEEPIVGAGFNDNRRNELGETYDQELNREYDEEVDVDRDHNLDRDYDDSNLSDEEKIQLHEEHLKVDKNREQTGEVVVNKEVVSEEQEVEVPVQREKVTIERRPVDETQRVSGDFDSELSDDEIRIPVHEEKVNVEKETVVSEEIVIKKQVEDDVETVKDTVRKEEVHIEDEDNLTE